METTKFYAGNFMIEILLQLCSMETLKFLCSMETTKFYTKFYYDYVVWKLLNFIMIDFIFIGE